MKMRDKIIVFLMFFFSSAAMAQTTASVDSTLRVLNRLYERGDYSGTELGARRALESFELSDSLRIEVEKLLAFALVAQGNTKGALEHFEQILSIDKEYTLDPVFTSPKILSVFQKAQEQFAETLKKKEQLPALAFPQREEPTVSYRVLLFPGLEQLHQKRKTAGYVLLGTGFTTLGIAIYTSIERANYRKQYLDAKDVAGAQALYAKYNRYHKARAYAAYAFLCIYLYSEIDAFLFLPTSRDVAFRVSLDSENTCLMLAISF